MHDVTAEIRNTGAQREVSASLLRELNFQMTETQRKIDETTDELLRTQDELAQKRALLDRRLRDIYKRGPLQAEEVLLTAHSFADLLNRYKYLYLVALRDRRLVGEVGELQHQLELREHELRRSYTDMQYLQNSGRGARAAGAWRGAPTRCRAALHERTRWRHRRLLRDSGPSPPDGQVEPAAARRSAATRPRRRQAERAGSSAVAAGRPPAATRARAPRPQRP